MSKENKWLIWSIEHNAWWGTNRIGYTKSRKLAGRYSEQDAADIVHGANIARDDDQPPQEAMVLE